MARRKVSTEVIKFEDYFNFLLDMITGPDEDDISMVSSFRCMLHKLYSTTFYSYIPRDDNRAADGTELRYLFGDRTEKKVRPGKNVPEGEANVLEVLVGLAFRMERDILHVDDYGDRTYEWFWLMMDNLTLSDEKFQDDILSIDDKKRAEIDEILLIFLDRRYDFYGDGGLFPLEETKNNQKNVEIWYQMSEYIYEKGLCDV